MPAQTSSTPSSLLERTSSIGFAPGDDQDTRVRKRVVTLTAVIACIVVTPWTIFYYVIGIPQAAVIPTFYVIATALTLAHFARTKNDQILRSSQLFFFLVLPPLVHIALGGFANSSAVVMYASVVPIGALAFAGTRHPVGWFVAFSAIVVGLIPFDDTFKQWAPDIPSPVVTSFFAANIVSTALINFLALLVYVRSRQRLVEELAVERERSDELLLNVLPESVAQRLKDGERPIADRYEDVGVLFADIVDFTPLAEGMTPEELVSDLNGVFSRFDELSVAHGVEKVKTIGDAYMVISGAPDPGPDINVLADLALAMRDAAAEADLGGRRGIRMRFGMDVGPLVAGVIGESRFIYDVYGDTVNTASRMESNGTPDQIQITGRVADRLDDRFLVARHGVVDIKGKGPTETFVLEGRLVVGADG